jgi:hypothetical protein
VKRVWAAGIAIAIVGVSIGFALGRSTSGSIHNRTTSTTLIVHSRISPPVSTPIADLGRSLIRALLPNGSFVDGVWSASRHGPFFVESHRHLSHRDPSVKYEFGLNAWSVTAFTWRGPRITRPAWTPDVLLKGWPTPILSESEISYPDVTHDGRPDALVAVVGLTNHLCGPRYVFAESGGHVRIVYRQQYCETYWKVRRGSIHFDEAWYGKNDSMCCPSRRRLFVLRWDGRRFERVGQRFVRERYGTDP